MLTLYYSPQSRATRVNALLHAMDRVADVQIRTMDIIRHDGTATADTHYPPLRQVPGSGSTPCQKWACGDRAPEPND